MKRLWIVFLVIVALAALGVGAWLYFRANPTVWEEALRETGLAPPDPRGIVASGFLEAEEVQLASELGGRLVELLAEKGDDVEAGQLLIRLDTALLDAQIASADAEVAVARAELAQAEAGPRPEQIRQAEVGVAHAEAAREGAYQAWQDAIALRDNPQDLDVEIAQARARVAAAEAAVERAEAHKDAAEIGDEAFHDAREAIQEAQERWEELPEGIRPPKPVLETQLEFHLLPNQYWQAWVGLNTAKAELEAARTALSDLYRMRRNPQELETAVNAAKARHESAQAAVEGAEAQLALLEAGATREEIATLEAQVQQAEASLATLQTQREKLTLAAPVGGLVLETGVREGELAAPGAPILVLGTLDEVTLTVYVPVNELGRVQLGQAVEVRPDAFPGRTFTGEVVAIASEAEFTPRNVQAQEERAEMVFGVEIRIPNPDHALKPGGSAEATIVEATIVEATIVEATTMTEGE